MNPLGPGIPLGPGLRVWDQFQMDFPAFPSQGGMNASLDGQCD